MACTTLEHIRTGRKTREEVRFRGSIGAGLASVGIVLGVVVGTLGTGCHRAEETPPPTTLFSAWWRADDDRLPREGRLFDGSVLADLKSSDPERVYRGLDALIRFTAEDTSGEGFDAVRTALLPVLRDLAGDPRGASAHEALQMLALWFRKTRAGAAGPEHQRTETWLAALAMDATQEQQVRALAIEGLSFARGAVPVLQGVLKDGSASLHLRLLATRSLTGTTEGYQVLADLADSGLPPMVADAVFDAGCLRRNPRGCDPYVKGANPEYRRLAAEQIGRRAPRPTPTRAPTPD